MKRGKEFSLDKVYDEKYAGVKYNLDALERSEPLNRVFVAKLISCGRQFSKWGWAPAYNSTGSSGNLGFRDKKGIAVTATNTNLGRLVNEDVVRVVEVDYETNPPIVFYEKSDGRKPTSELLAYWEIFNKRKDVGVILHGHDKLTTIMAGIISRYYPGLAASTEKNIPYGTKDFAFALRDKLTERSRYLIARGHGFFSLGSNFGEALLYARIIHDLTNFVLRPYAMIRGSGFVESHLSDRLEGRVARLSGRLIEPLISSFAGKSRLMGEAYLAAINELVCPAVSLVEEVGGAVLSKVGSGVRVIRGGTRRVRKILGA